MAKQQKYYAIKEGKDVKNKIVRTWSECEALVKCYPSVYKSFKTEDEALEYLGTIKDVKKKLEENNKAKEYNKAKKRGTVSIANLLKGVRIDKEVAEEFEAKCNDLNISKEKIVNELIKEWVD
ncbi:MAG: RNase H1/viroplasmin domain-containing protein [Clostridium sp.]|uniref:RNase H1/viroplasmin domain-containing protein n=1 Tax=Clostridium sp. TaxID=1506 RepID=UPI0025BF1E89|nr:RNase H1/viroplasmin domain-containing protein [Clostridium sp.]MBS4956600.1 RNase H1/viroplasmin domain-containing protein [Clostridium sp.]